MPDVREATQEHRRGRLSASNNTSSTPLTGMPLAEFDPLEIG